LDEHKKPEPSIANVVDIQVGNDKVIILNEDGKVFEWQKPKHSAKDDICIANLIFPRPDHISKI
jgi:alpha-tubulin suppressor-like RCC1 family protein